MTATASVPRGTDETFGGLVQEGETPEQALRRIEGTRAYTKVIATDEGQRLLEAATAQVKASANGGVKPRRNGSDAEALAKFAAGRGLAPAPAVPTATLGLVSVPLDAIDVGANVRVDPGELDELAASIREHGVLQPVKVIEQPDGRYNLVWGQRRILAARKAGLAVIPAIVDLAPGDRELVEAGAKRSIEQLVENLLRSDLNPIEEANALRAVLAADPSLTQADLARRLGRSAPWVSNALAVLEAPEKVQELVREGQLTTSHVKALRGLAPKTQEELAGQAVKRGESAHQLEDSVQAHKRSEEWRKRREAEEREAAKKQTEQWRAAIATKLKKAPKDAAIYVVSYYGSGRTGHAAKLLRDAGFTNVTERSSSGGNLQSRSQATGCDCAAWKVAPEYDRLVIVPACLKQAHLVAKTQADDAKRAAKYELQRRVQEALPAAIAPMIHVVEGPAALEDDLVIGLHRLPARMALWHALGYRVADWAEKRGGKRGNPWPTIVALSDAELATELAAAVAEAFRDHYGYHVPWDEIAAEVGVPVETPKADA